MSRHSRRKPRRPGMGRPYHPATPCGLDFAKVAIAHSRRLHMTQHRSKWARSCLPRCSDNPETTLTESVHSDRQYILGLLMQRMAALRRTSMSHLRAKAAIDGSASGWDRLSGWSRRSLRGQELRAAPPQVRFEPKMKDAATCSTVRFRSGGRSLQRRP